MKRIIPVWLCPDNELLYNWDVVIRAGCMLIKQCVRLVGGAVAQSVERATAGEEVLGPIPVVAARSLLVGSVSV